MSIGPVAHEFSMGSASVVVNRIEGWEATEQAPGGVMSASGEVSEDLVSRYPDVLTYGAIWRTYIGGTKESRFGGRLLDPAINAGRATLVARGWGSADKQASNRFMPQTRDYGLWSGMDSEPFGSSGHGYLVADAITTIVGNGRLRLKIDGAGNADPASADIGNQGTVRSQNGLLAWFPGVSIKRIACRITLNQPVQPGTLELAFLKGKGTKGALTLIQDGTNPYALGPGAAQVRDIDLRLTANADVIAIVIRNQQSTNQWARQATAVSITNLRVNGIGYSDTYAASRFVTEVFGRIGLEDIAVAGNETNTLPYDLDDNAPYADALDYANLLTGYRHRVVDRDGARRAEWGPWGPVWEVPDDAHTEFAPLDRYDAVRIPFQTSGGQTDEAYVRDPAAISEVPNVFEDFALAGRYPNREAALEMAHQALTVLSGRRVGGTGFLTEVIVPGTADRVSAQYVQAGDILRYPHRDNLEVRAAELRRTASRVEFTAEERIAALERLVASYNRRQHLRGRY